MPDSAPPVSDLDLFDDALLVAPYPSYAALACGAVGQRKWAVWWAAQSA